MSVDTGQQVEMPEMVPAAWVNLMDGTTKVLYSLQPRQYQAYCLTPLARPRGAEYPRHIAYGGAAGGGKSYLARAVAVAGALKWPGINVLILRRTEGEVKQNHVKPFREKEVPQKLPDGRRLYKWNGSELCATFVNGSSIYFGYLDISKDRERYSGNEYDIVIFEESTHYAWEDVRWLSGNRNRATTDLSLPFCLYPSNPGRQGHHWYKRLFIDERYDPSLNEDPDDYAFIQAKVEHNHILRKRDPGYVKQLDTLPEPLRSWLRDGDFDAGLGLALTMIEKERHIIQPFEIPDSWLKFGAFDWGYAHPFSFGIYTVNEDGRMFKVDTMTGRHLGPRKIARAIKSRLTRWDLLPPSGGDHPRRLKYIVTGKDAFDEHRSRDDNTQSIAEQFLEENVLLKQGNQARIHGLNVMRRWLAWEGMGPDGDDIRPPLQFFDTPGNRQCVDQLASMPVDEDNPEDALKRDADQFGQGGDDMYDETRLACVSRPTPDPSEWDQREFDAWHPDEIERESKEQRKSRPPKSMRKPSRVGQSKVVHPEFGAVY